MNSIDERSDNEDDGRKKKKRKLFAMDDTAANLLKELRTEQEDCLRYRLKALEYNTSCERAMEKKNLIVKGMNGFPKTLRSKLSSIDLPSETTSSKSTFRFVRRSVLKIEEEVELFLCQGRVPELDERNILKIPEAPNNFQGLNSDVDTEEEVELLIRLFPFTLQKIWVPNIHGPKAILFLPLFVRLKKEYNYSRISMPDYLSAEYRMDGMSCEFHLVDQLLSNHAARYVLSKKPSSEWIDVSIAVIARLIEDESLAFNRNEWYAMFCSLLIGLTKSKNFEFFEKNVRSLAIFSDIFYHLVVYDFLTESLVTKHRLSGSFWYLNQDIDPKPVEFDYKSWGFQAFDVLVEATMNRHPKKLGFAFDVRNSENYFLLACNCFGSERTTRMIVGHIAKLVGKAGAHGGLALQSMVIAAVNCYHNSYDRRTGIDGLHTLVRFFPGVLFSSRTSPSYGSSK